MRRLFLLLLALFTVFGCSKLSSKATQPEEKKADISMKKVYEMTPQEVDLFIKEMRKEYPKLPDRVVAIAKRNLGQLYKLHLLGEFPFEIYDKEPIFSIENGDCVVFSEHMYAMALAYDWQSFFAFLQRIRYKNGEISVLTRNHYTLADWDVNNSWLLRDITPEIGGAKAEKVVEKINRTKFFKGRYKLDAEFAPENYETTYIPAASLKDVAPYLKNGDFINFIRGKDKESEYCGHVGLITVSPDGTVNILHSISPKSVEQPFIEYVNDQIERNKERAKKGEVQFQGLKFLRLKEDPYSELVKIDGPDAPVVTAPKGLIKKMPSELK